jgi:2,5-dihydroxypyridine 5,6-dioxygenase
MAISDLELVRLFRHVLALSRVGKDQSVAVLKSSDSNPRLAAAAVAAAQDLGSRVFSLELPAVHHSDALGYDRTGYLGATPLTGHVAAKKALAAVDLVVDTMMLLHSAEQEEILKSGTRMLLVVEPPEILCRMLPSEDDKRRVVAAAEKLQRARQFTVHSRAGTELRTTIGSYPVLKEYGFAEERGRWDHWPSGFLATWADEGSAEGKIVIDVGDILLPFKTYAQSPITLEIERGYVKRIHGKFDAEYLDSYMKSFRDPEVFAISHIGWGLQPKAQWTALGLYEKDDTIGMDARAFYGNFLFSTGPNTEAGGTRNTPCHMDIPMRNCTVLLDNEPMVVEGDVVQKDQMVPH